MAKQATKLRLHEEWSKRLSLWVESNKLRIESDKLWVESDKLRVESNKLWVESNKLWVESDKLRAEGDKLWAEAIIAVYGNVLIEWTWRSDAGECRLANGDVYDQDEGDQL